MVTSSKAACTLDPKGLYWRHPIVVGNSQAPALPFPCPPLPSINTVTPNLQVKQAAVAGLSALLPPNQRPLPLSLVRLAPANSCVNPNGGPTWSSTGSEGNCQAILNAAGKVVERLRPSLQVHGHRGGATAGLSVRGNAWRGTEWLCVQEPDVELMRLQLATAVHRAASTHGSVNEWGPPCL